MESEAYLYTLNSLLEDAAGLQSASVSLKNIPPDILTHELKKAFSDLAKACEDYLEVYAETSREPIL